MRLKDFEPKYTEMMLNKGFIKESFTEDCGNGVLRMCYRYVKDEKEAERQKKIKERKEKYLF